MDGRRDAFKASKCIVAACAANGTTEVTLRFPSGPEVACGVSQVSAMAEIFCRVAFNLYGFRAELSGCKVEITPDGALCSLCLIHGSCMVSAEAGGRDVPQAMEEAWWLVYQQTLAPFSV